LDPISASLITYGPLGIAVVGLAWALVYVFKRSDTRSQEYEKSLKDLQQAHAVKIEEIHAKHRDQMQLFHAQHNSEIQALHKSQVEDLRQVIETANQATEANSEFTGQLAAVIERLTATKGDAPKIEPNKPEPKRGRG